MTRAEWLRRAEQQLIEAGVDSPRLDAELLLAHSLGVSRATLRIHLDDSIPEGVDGLLERRLLREPLSYILGKKEFFGRDFAVGPGVLVPRPETEILVERALKWLAGKPGARILDVGTGSGCIAITLALEMPGSQVCAVDISADALQAARSNGHALGANVEWLELDGFPPGGTFDLVVSNPPYIASAYDLSPEVGQYEPSLALFGGEDGLDFYRRLATEAPNHLSPAGAMILEIGFDQGETVPRILEESGWVDCTVTPDLSGLPRVVQASRP